MVGPFPLNEPVSQHSQYQDPVINGIQKSLRLLITPVIFLLFHIKMSAVTKVYCNVSGLSLTGEICPLSLPLPLLALCSVPCHKG